MFFVSIIWHLKFFSCHFRTLAYTPLAECPHSARDLCNSFVKIIVRPANYLNPYSIPENEQDSFTIALPPFFLCYRLRLLPTILQEVLSSLTFVIFVLLTAKKSDIANIREILNNLCFFILPVLIHQLPLLPLLLLFHNPRSLPVPIFYIPSLYFILIGSFHFVNLRPTSICIHHIRLFSSPLCFKKSFQCSCRY